MSRIANLMGVSRTTELMVMVSYINLGKMSSEKQNIVLKKELTDFDRRELKRIVARKHKIVLPQIISKINFHKQIPYTPFYSTDHS